jgi:polyferredoxin
MLEFKNIFTGILALICALYTVFSARMKFGTITQPGPGFVPVFIGVAGLMLSLFVLISGLRKSNGKKSKDIDKKEKIRLVAFIIISVIFIPLSQYLGSILAIFILVLTLTKLFDSQGWVRPILFAAICSATVYVVFDTLLGVFLPQGIFFN